jgi:beta-glucosidase
VRAEATVFHHLLYAHGLAAQAYDHAQSIGIALNLFPTYPASDGDADREAARGSDGYTNRWFLDPLYGRGYPDDQRARFEALIGELDFVRDGDTAVIAAPTEYLGVNYYAPREIEAVPGDVPWPWRVTVPEEWPTTAGFTGGVASTGAGTPIAPHGLTDLLVRLHRDYAPRGIMVTENGAVFPEPQHDERRVAFLRDHLAAVDDAAAQGAPMLGYCHWSLMDNFEWKLGYAQRFGLVHVDYETQERTIKDSGRFYRDEIARRRA